MTDQITEVRWVPRDDIEQLQRLHEQGYTIEDPGGYHGQYSLMASKVFEDEKDG